MESKTGSDSETYVLPGIRNLTAEDARKLLGGPVATWLATVALVLIVIVAALSLEASRERKKHTEDSRARIAASRGVSTR